MGQPDGGHGQTVACNPLPNHPGICRAGTDTHYFHTIVLGLELKYRWLLGVVAIASLVLVVLTFQYPHQMISLGNLSPAHQDLTDDCFACHTPFFGASEERCVSCHVVEDIGIRTTARETIAEPEMRMPFHQHLTEQDCTACHADHTGTRLADNPHPFSHLLLKPETREQCSNCHVAPKNEVHQNLTENCTQCHSATAWKPAMFDHDEFFELDKHHNTTCVTCHVNNVHTEFTCFGCHEHTPTNIRREHEEEGIREFDNCVECHRNAHDEPENEGGGRERSGDNGRDNDLG